MATALWVAVGGAIGSVARYGVAGVVNSSAHPWGTVLVNLVGSFALGLVVGVWGFELTDSHRVGIAIGLLGGFTTFSAFSVDVLRLWESGRGVLAVSSVVVSVLGGLVAALAGILLARAVSG